MASLLEIDDSLLVAVDVQPGFLARVEPERAAESLGRAAWLVGVAAALEVPVLATTENADRWGGVHEAIAARLPAGAEVHDKRVFGLAGDPPVLAALEGTGRRSVVLLGLETDVCVAQSAIGLRERGLDARVVMDATASPGDAHEHGLERLRGAGVPLVSAKGVFMEWVRTPAACRAFEAAHPELFTDAPVLV
ncbi:MAG TPA: isochorismatase family protein [Thermoleophilaceae bacterium]|nr:isochorismatase family protein [Thermoleophilaceae bacterium]